jgi:hypothetical protein
MKSVSGALEAAYSSTNGSPAKASSWSRGAET